MNEDIMDWSSTYFYLGKLYAAESVKHRRLCDIPDVVNNDFTKTVLKMFDTKDQGFTEMSNNARSGPSFANMGEAALVVDYVTKLISYGVKAEEIAIIAPYNYQVEILNANLLEKYPELEIKSVDGFQGREKEVVIISMVRSNEKKNLGFLTEKRRLNVAVTRAKRQLVLICDSETVSKDEFLDKFVKYVRERGQVEAAQRLRDLEAKMIIPKKQAVKIVKPALVTSLNKPSLAKVVALDCEMVGIGEGGVKSSLARISIVDSEGNILLDKFVASKKEITDYRTKVSGITPETLRGADSFSKVMRKVKDILLDKIIVGHGLRHDFRAMKFVPPKSVIRDTAVYLNLNRGKTPSLKALTKEHLTLDIQSGEHDSVEDARAAMKLYLKFRDEWESSPRVAVKSKNKRSKVTSPKKTPMCDYTFEKLKTLPADHVFTDNLYLAFSGSRAYKFREWCRWAREWMKKPNNKPDSKLSPRKPGVNLKEALNLLSSKQLEVWVKTKEAKLKEIY